MVSSAYRASDFVATMEMPTLLQRAAKGGLTVKWIPVSASAYTATALRDIQALISPSRPLDQMKRPQADKTLVEIAHSISGGRAMTDLARAMRTIDTVYAEVSSQAGVSHAESTSVQAHHTGTSIEYQRRGVAVPIAVISAADLDALSGQQHLLIQSMELTMNGHFERWATLRPKRPTLTPSEIAEFESSGREMCAELNRILGFIDQVPHKDLQDHYETIRWSCQQIVQAPA
jgi:hypothetical protein